MAKEDKYSIKDLKREFPTDNKCLEHIFNSNHSKHCACGGSFNKLPKRRQYQCSKCRKQIAPCKGTIFEKSSTPLTLWFHALFIFSNAKSGISAKEMERQLGVTYKTAWRLLKLIREQLNQDDNNSTPLQGEVEMDEAFFGGKGKGGKYNKNSQQVYREKTKVIGAVERKGRARIKNVEVISAKTLGDFLKENISPKQTVLFTDGGTWYKKIAEDYERYSVNHWKEGIFQSGYIHTNSIESFWSHIKRSIKGTHKVISKKYFQTYLDAFVWHYNLRTNDRKRFVSLLELLA